MKEFKLGVLFVHGIGTQPARETLVRWGDVLLKVIARATATPGQIISIVGRASGGDPFGDNPAEVPVDIHYGGQTEKWLLAEGWWAGSFPGPTYSELVSWCVRAIPWSIALHIAQRYWQTDPGASGRAKLIAYTTAICQFIGAMAFAPVFVTLLALSLVLGLLPIPQLRSLIVSTQTTLIGTVGESLAFVESPLRVAFIRGRILDALERLKARCESTIIVAHSQGAAAVLDALGGITQAPDHEEPTGTEPSAGSLVPDALVTFGSGVNQLVSLKVLGAGLPHGSNPAVVASGAITVTIVFATFIYFSLRLGRTNVWSLGEAAAALLGLMIGTLLLKSGVDVLFRKLTEWRVLAERKTAGFDYRKLWIVGPAALVAFNVYMTYTDKLPVYPTGALVLALFFLGLSLREILSPAYKDAVTKPVRKPPGLARWVDLYSSADPVPNGPTRIAETLSAQTSSVKVWNRGSILSDHTTYWENLDGFVLRVARVCAGTAESPWRDKLLPATRMSWVDRRAAWRVSFLQWTRWINVLFWVFAFTIIWLRHGAGTPLLFELPSWSPVWTITAERFVEIALFFVLCTWGTAGLLRWPWTRWVRAEQEQILAHRNPPNSPWNVSWPLYGIGVVITALLMLALALLLGFESRPGELLTPELIGLPVFLNVGGFFFAILAVWLKPGPPAPEMPGSKG